MVNRRWQRVSVITTVVLVCSFVLGNAGLAAAGEGVTAIATLQPLLSDQGFESGTTSSVPWVATAGVINNSAGEPPHSGTWYAWMDGYGTAHTDSLYQQASLSASATTVTLTFWLHIDTAETTGTTAYDTLAVQIRNTSNAVLATLATYSNLNHNTGYVQKSFNLTAFKGQTIRIYLLGTEDSSRQTSFVVDDFALGEQ